MLTQSIRYTYPVTLRTRLEALWGVDLSDWWLPNEEGCPPLVRQIRNFITSTPNDATGEDLRDFKGIFASLSLSDTSSPESTHYSPESHDNRLISPRRGSEKAPGITSGHSDDGQLDWDSLNAHDRAVAFGESPEFEWS